MHLLLNYQVMNAIYFESFKQTASQPLLFKTAAAKTDVNDASKNMHFTRVKMQMTFDYDISSKYAASETHL